jgi:hypothetical protein
MYYRGGTFSKNLILKEDLKHCQYIFKFLINIIYFLKFQYNGHLGVKFLLWLAMIIWWSYLVDLSSWWSYLIHFSSRWLHYGRTRLLKTFFCCLYIFSSIPSLASNNHVLDWNSWPIGALFHWSIKWPLVQRTCAIVQMMICPT